MHENDCDICTKKSFTTTLSVDYSTDDIKEVCSDCFNILSDHKSKLQKMMFAINHTFIEKLMYELRSKLKVIK